MYSTLVGGAHGHLILVLTDAQYAPILNTPLVYQDHPGPFIITDGMTAHTSSNMCIVHTEKVCHFREVTGLEQSLVQHIFSTVEEAYLADICNRTTS